MGTAILPAQDYLASYKANKNRHSAGKAYHRVNSLRSENNTVHSHGISGSSPDIDRMKTDPKWLQNYVASNAVNSGKCCRLWPSPSSRAGVDSENISFLKRPHSTTPKFDVDGALLGDSFSIFYGQRPFYSYSSTNSSGQRFGYSLQQSFSTRQYFHDPKLTMGNIVHAEAKGRRGGQQNKNLVTEKVTILKRGETIKNAVGKDPDKKSQVRQKTGHSSDRVVVNNVEYKLSSPKRNKSGWASKTVAKVCGDESKTIQAARRTDCEDVNLAEMIDDLIISTDPLGPDPSVLPKEGSGILQSVSSGVKASEAIVNELPKMLKEFQYVSSFDGVDDTKVGSPSSSDFASPVFESEKWAGPAYSNSPPPSSLPFPKFYMQQMRSIAMDLIDANHCSKSVEYMDSSPVSPSEEKVHPALPVAAEKSQSTFAAVRSCSNSLQFGVDTSATKDLRRLLGLD